MSYCIIINNELKLVKTLRGAKRVATKHKLGIVYRYYKCYRRAYMELASSKVNNKWEDNKLLF